MCREVVSVCNVVELASLVRDHTAQMSLVGLQLAWTHQVEVAIESVKTSKTALIDATKQQLMVLAELSSWCLTDLGSDMNRYGQRRCVHDHQQDQLCLLWWLTGRRWRRW